MAPYVLNEPPSGASSLHRITVRNAQDLDAVSIEVRFDASRGPAAMLALFARAAIEVCVVAREARRG